MSTDPLKVWKTIHNLDVKYAVKVKNEVLTVENVALIDDKDKAEAFSKT